MAESGMPKNVDAESTGLGSCANSEAGAMSNGASTPQGSRDLPPRGGLFNLLSERRRLGAPVSDVQVGEGRQEYLSIQRRRQLMVCCLQAGLCVGWWRIPFTT
jgi:hypothetical protein